MRLKRQVEVLSPAGSYESMVAAVKAGADAVYLGGNAFGARAYANNFDKDELLKAIDYVHIHDRKLYMTVNTLLKNDELEENLYEYIKPYYEAGLDAVIVQDMGVFRMMKEYFPAMDIHASTQMTITGVEGAKLLKSMGASRVVTARELSLAELKEISTNVEIEIESFVHGALCYCYSGQCLLSSMIGGRSGNRGRCAQPCRLPYEVLGAQNAEKYVLSPKDISTLTILPQIIESGVYSLKIEGRMKNSEYTAGVVSKYRKYVNEYLEFGKDKYKVSEHDISDLMDLYNRGGFTEGYYVNKNGRDMISLTRPNHMGTKALTVIDNEKGSITFKAMEQINPGDIFEVGQDHSFTSGKSVSEGENLVVNLPSKYNIRKGDIVYRTKNGALSQQLCSDYIDAELNEKISGVLELIENEEARLTLHILDQCKEVMNTVTVNGDIVQAALKQPMTEEKIRKQLEKTGGSGFEFEELDIHMSNHIFMPVQSLNDLRRNAIEQLKLSTCNMYRRKTAKQDATTCERIKYEGAAQSVRRECNQAVNVAVNSSLQLDVILEYDKVNGVYLDTSFYSDTDAGIHELCLDIQKCHNAGKCIYIRMPYIFRMKTRDIFDSQMKAILDAGVDGFLVKNVDELYYISHYSHLPIHIILDYNVYAYNHMAKMEYERVVPENVEIIYDTAPLELNESELKTLGIMSSELVVYGKIPVMVSAQCVKKTTGTCDGKSGNIYIKDRKDAKFNVQSCCKYCYSVMYNDSAIYLLDRTISIDKLNPLSLRLEFTDEDEATIRMIMNCLGQPHEMSKNYTRGHFLRGVE